jgi:hypothetical protein
MARDRLRARKVDSNMGAGALARGGEPNWDLAVVLSYNVATHTTTARSHTGAPLENLPQIRTGARDFTTFEPGQTVVISYDLGFPAILGVLSDVGLPQAAIGTTSVTGVDGVGDDNPLQPTEGTNNYKPAGAPTDMTAGDWVKTGDLGSVIALLMGGIAQMGSPKAMVRALGAAGLLQTIAQRMTTVTDFGEWKVTNDQGRTSFILRAGANQSTQTGLDEQHWTIRLDVGATGDLFNFQITDPAGRTLFKLHVGADGRTQIYGDAGVDISSGSGGDNEALRTIAGDRTESVGGADATTVNGARSRTVGSSSTENITTDKTTAIGNDESRFVNKDQTVNVGGKRTDIVVGGPADEAKAGAWAIEAHAVNGGYLIDIGNPDDGANISAQAAFQLRTSLGDIGLDSGSAMKLSAKQNVDVRSQTLITLGGQTYSLLLTEDFLRDLSNFLTTLLAVLQGGTVGVAAKQSLVALPGATAQLQQFITQLQTITYKSTKVKNS